MSFCEGNIFQRQTGKIAQCYPEKTPNLIKYLPNCSLLLSQIKSFHCSPEVSYIPWRLIRFNYVQQSQKNCEVKIKKSIPGTKRHTMMDEVNT